MTTSNNSLTKYFFLAVSVIAHAVLIYFIAYKALDYSLPQGQVSSYEMTIKGNLSAPTPVTIRPQPPKIIAQNTKDNIAPLPKPTEAPKVLATPKPVAAKAPSGTLPTKEDVEASHEQEKPDLSSDQTEAPNKEEEDAEQAPKTETQPAPEAEVAPTTAPTESSTEAPAKENPPAETTQAQQTEAPNANTQTNSAESAKQPLVTTGENTSAQGAVGSVQSDAVLTPLSGNAPISYPMMARLRKLEGESIVHYSVDGDGNVTKVDIIQSSGSSVLDNEVVSTIEGWKFAPTGQDGIYERPVKFTLKGSAQEAPGQLRRINN